MAPTTPSDRQENQNVREKRSPQDDPGTHPSSLTGWRVGSELVGGLITGLILGWGADTLWNIKPWGIVVGVVLGCLAGIWGVCKLALQMHNTKSEN